LRPLGSRALQIAVVGLRNRGWELILECVALPGVQLRALCDVDGNILDAYATDVFLNLGYRPDTYQDLRDLLRDDQIDAVVIAAPTHWHALATIWSCQAGKHVYVEKPGCLTLREGSRMVRAARTHGRLVQVGFQNRSSPGVRAAMAFLAGGGLGRLYLARAICYKPRPWIGDCQDGVGQGPGHAYFIFGEPGEHYPRTYLENVDYDLWLGPAPVRPFNYNRFHYNWHWHWDYGGGDMANQAVHQLDIARWGLGKGEHPVSVVSQGTYAGPKGNQETPNVQTAIFRYADGTLLEAQVRGMPTNGEMGVTVGNFFYGTEGWMWLDGDRWATFFGRGNEPGPASDPSPGEGGHVANFVEAVRAGRGETLTCGVGEGYLSAALPALANISYRTGGRTLRFDGEKERFANDARADALLGREYRTPFTMPREA
jgi:predicted dehydrogenase